LAIGARAEGRSGHVTRHLWWILGRGYSLPAARVQTAGRGARLDILSKCEAAYFAFSSRKWPNEAIGLDRAMGHDLGFGIGRARPLGTRRSRNALKPTGRGLRPRRTYCIPICCFDRCDSAFARTSPRRKSRSQPRVRMAVPDEGRHPGYVVATADGQSLRMCAIHTARMIRSQVPVQAGCEDIARVDPCASPLDTAPCGSCRCGVMPCCCSVQVRVEHCTKACSQFSMGPLWN
jgi:hypothetical protein